MDGQDRRDGNKNGFSSVLVSVIPSILSIHVDFLFGLFGVLVLSIWISSAVAGDYSIDESQQLIEKYDDAMAAVTNGNCKEAEAILRKANKTEAEIGRRAKTPELMGMAERLKNIRQSVQNRINDAKGNGKCM